jgi:hypothetical protein
MKLDQHIQVLSRIFFCLYASLNAFACMMDLNFCQASKLSADASLRLPNTNRSNNKDNDGGDRAIFLASLCYCIFLKKT